jgi:hypothetical protein
MQPAPLGERSNGQALVTQTVRRWALACADIGVVNSSISAISTNVNILARQGFQLLVRSEDLAERVATAFIQVRLAMFLDRRGPISGPL